MQNPEEHDRFSHVNFYPEENTYIRVQIRIYRLKELPANLYPELSARADFFPIG
jgi:hypothetical protein